MTNEQKATKAMKEAIKRRDNQSYWRLKEYKVEHSPTNGEAFPNAVAVIAAQTNGDTIKIILSALGEHRWEIDIVNEESLDGTDRAVGNAMLKELKTIINNDPPQGLERFQELFLGFKPAMWYDFKRDEETQALTDLKPL